MTRSCVPAARRSHHGAQSRRLETQACPSVRASLAHTTSPAHTTSQARGQGSGGTEPFHESPEPSAVAPSAADTARVPTSDWRILEPRAPAVVSAPGPNPLEARWVGPQTRHRWRKQRQLTRSLFDDACFVTPNYAEAGWAECRALRYAAAASAEYRALQHAAAASAEYRALQHAAAAWAEYRARRCAAAAWAECRARRCAAAAWAECRARRCAGAASAGCRARRHGAAGSAGCPKQQKRNWRPHSPRPKRLDLPS